MSDGAIFLIAIFLIVLRLLYMLATRKKIKVEPYYPYDEDWGTGEFIYQGGKSNLHRHNNTGD